MLRMNLESCRSAAATSVVRNARNDASCLASSTGRTYLSCANTPAAANKRIAENAILTRPPSRSTVSCAREEYRTGPGSGCISVRQVRLSSSDGDRNPDLQAKYARPRVLDATCSRGGSHCTASRAEPEQVFGLPSDKRPPRGE